MRGGRRAGAAARRFPPAREKNFTTRVNSGTSGVGATIHRWAIALGMDDAVLRRKLSAIGIDTSKHQQIPARDIYHSLFGDREQARIRRDAAQAALYEARARVLAGELIERKKAGQMVAAVANAARELLQSMPTILAEKLSPGAPEKVLPLLNSWRDGALQTLNRQVLGLE